eukprot:comp20376_c0_seq1/m.25750 comp20376_c0_seq1/g.25750  ORF comp20376_c0_seq1/g.25750 comp20376_c0_seq1/m.25750 type:complete len:208 (-) comp20376_c0_seq1:475-1098(-)
MTAQGAPSSAITLKGSTETVAEFFGYAINSILYQRGIYPPNTFTDIKKYGVPIMITTDVKLAKYIQEVLEFLRSWLGNHNAQKLILLISRADNGEALERWQFDIDCDRTVTATSAPKQKEESAIQREIQFLIRQIVASNTFLPTLDTACTFELLVYADKDMETPQQWNETDPHYVQNPEEVHLRSFSTTIHRIAPTVAYKVGAATDM